MEVAQGWAPVIPATHEAEAENCLNLGDGGCHELRSHHCTPAWATEQDSISKKKKKKNKIEHASLSTFALGSPLLE